MLVNLTRNRILIDPIETQKTSSGGIILGTAVEEKNVYGKVVKIGPGEVTKQGITVMASVNVGDTVLFDKENCDTVFLESKNFFIVKETDILAVVEN